MNIAIFTGAGISAESGIETFRSSSNALWNNHSIEEVATPKGWAQNPQLVTDFYNSRRMQLNNVYPNSAHDALVELEKDFNVTIITQNVDDLHERAGSSTIFKLHGDLQTVRSEFDENDTYNWKYNPIDLENDRGKNNSRLRPDIVWFGEMPKEDAVIKGTEAISESDILIIVGTSLQIGYTHDMLRTAPNEVYYIDPSPKYYLDEFVDNGEMCPINYIRKNATDGVRYVVDEILSDETYKSQYV